MGVLTLDLAMENLQWNTDFPPWSGIRYFYGDSEIAFAGDDSGRVLDVECPWGTQEMAENLLDDLRGLVYAPYSASNAILDPAAELGDTLLIDGVDAPLVHRATEFDGLCASDISAPGDESLDHKYPYTSPELAAWRQAQRNLANITVGMDSIKLDVQNKDATLRALINMIAGEIRAEVSDAVQELNSEIALIPGHITLRVTNDATGQYASIELLVDGNPYSIGKILLNGNVNVSGTLSARELYAQLGDIAHLVVDSLSTSRRIAKYLARDTSDENFIRIQGVNQEFVAGIYSGGTIQAMDPFTALLFWEDNPEGEDVTFSPIGYPEKNNVPIYTTTTETPWPVMVYTYTEQVKAKWGFAQEGVTQSGAPVYTPSLTLGAGNAQGRNMAQIIKGLNGLEISYTANTGREIGLRATMDGYLDLYGQRRFSEIDFSQWDSGAFSLKLEGDAATYTQQVLFDAQRRPVGITDGDGFITQIKW